MRRRNIILLLLAILIVIDILRETEVITFNHYKSTISAQTNDNWDNSVLTLDYKKEDSTWLALKHHLDDSCNFDQSIQNVPSFASFDESSDESESTCQRLTIKVISFDPGAIWTPLYKATSFAASGVCSETIEIFSENTSQGFRKLYGLHGKFTVKGHINITGLCTSKEGKRLLKNFIVEQLTIRGQDQVNKQ